LLIEPLYRKLPTRAESQSCRESKRKLSSSAGRGVGGQIGSKDGILLRLVALSGAISTTEGEAGDKGGLLRARRERRRDVSYTCELGSVSELESDSA
jgi:hypothetical protein